MLWYVIKGIRNMKFQNNKLELLKELHQLVSQQLDNAGVNVDLEYEVADLLTEVKDRKRQRRLNLVRRELDKWLKEIAEYKKVQNA